jgi:hypothetical protein
MNPFSSFLCMENMEACVELSNDGITFPFMKLLAPHVLFFGNDFLPIKCNFVQLHNHLNLPSYSFVDFKAFNEFEGTSNVVSCDPDYW